MKEITDMVDRRHTRIERPFCQSFYLENVIPNLSMNRNLVR